MITHTRHAHLIATLALCALLASCATVPQQSVAGLQASVSDRLFFGRSIPGGGTVSDAEWSAFLREVVTPRFPDGLTVLRAEGQWRDSANAIVREESFVLELIHAGSAETESSIAAIIAEYKRRFRQEAVLRVRSGVLVGF
jgi:hypothetical protein